MKNIVYIQCPTELLVSLQLNSEKFAEIIKLYTAIALFKGGASRLSSWATHLS